MYVIVWPCPNDVAPYATIILLLWSEPMIFYRYSLDYHKCNSLTILEVMAVHFASMMLNRLLQVENIILKFLCCLG